MGQSETLVSRMLEYFYTLGEMKTSVASLFELCNSMGTALCKRLIIMSDYLGRAQLVWMYLMTGFGGGMDSWIIICSWKSPFEFHQCYIPMDVINLVDYGTTYDENYERKRIKLLKIVRF